MKCIICDSDSSFFFSKNYTEPPYNAYMHYIGEVQYYKCTFCGFVLSKTHAELENDQWLELNQLVHNHKTIGNQPPYLEQALMLLLLGKQGVCNMESILDYAAGSGQLSMILSKYFKIDLPAFDPYIQPKVGNKFDSFDQLSRYKTVINSAMFEHVLCRNDLNQVNNLVESNGCLIIHTLVCENIPKDPEWFYLRPPVHTAFHTNRSMEILMEQWGYTCSLYCPKSKSWVLFRNDSETVRQKAEAINQEFKTDLFYFKKGFVDYWKGF